MILKVEQDGSSQTFVWETISTWERLMADPHVHSHMGKGSSWKVGLISEHHGYRPESFANTSWLRRPIPAHHLRPSLPGVTRVGRGWGEGQRGAWSVEHWEQFHETIFTFKRFLKQFHFSLVRTQCIICIVFVIRKNIFFPLKICDSLIFVHCSAA